VLTRSLRTLLKKPVHLFYGWRMIAIGSAIRVLGGGLHVYGFTVFFLPLGRELGLSRASTSLVFSLARAEGALESPLAGYLIQRFGPRPVMLIAVMMSGVGYMLLAAVRGFWTLLLVYTGVISFSFASGFMHSPMILANTWFIRRRALAMTLISASVGLGGTLVTPLLALGVQSLGWRQGALLAGLSLLIIGIPLAASVRRSPESMGLLPDGASPPHPGTGVKQPIIAEAEITAAQAMRSPIFWTLTLATLLRVTGSTTMMVHFIPVMVWKGLTEQGAAFFLGAFAFLTLPAHLVFGWLADRVNKPRLMACGMMTSVIALLALTYGQGEWPLWLFTILFTVVEAIFPVSWATVGDLFGRRYFATIRGSMTFFYLWGGVLGPVIAGALYDRYQSYGPMLLGLAALSLIAVFLYSLLVKPTTLLRR